MYAKVKRKDYHKFMSDMADKVYKGEMSWKEYREMVVEFEPIDFTPYPTVTDTSKRYIESLFNEEDTDRKGKYMLRGFTQHEGYEMNVLGMSYGDYANAYSFYGYNDKEQMIYTYCEGDTTLKMFGTKEEYEKEKAETADWYRKEYA